MDDEPRLKKFVRKHARRGAPIKSPEFAFGIAAFVIGCVWSVCPKVFRLANRVPLISGWAQSIPFWHYISLYGGYVLAVFLTWLCIIPICRGIELCFSDYFECYNLERDTEMH